MGKIQHDGGPCLSAMPRRIDGWMTYERMVEWTDSQSAVRVFVSGEKVELSWFLCGIPKMTEFIIIAFGLSIQTNRWEQLRMLHYSTQMKISNISK